MPFTTGPNTPSRYQPPPEPLTGQSLRDGLAADSIRTGTVKAEPSASGPRGRSNARTLWQHGRTLAQPIASPPDSPISSDRDRRCRDSACQLVAPPGRPELMAIARLSSRPCLDPLDPRETLSIGSRAVRSGLARCDVVEKAKTADLLVVSADSA